MSGDLMDVENLPCGCERLPHPLLDTDGWYSLTPERREQIDAMLRRLDRWYEQWITAYSSDEARVALERLATDDDNAPIVCPEPDPDHVRTFVEVLPL